MWSMPPPITPCAGGGGNRRRDHRHDLVHRQFVHGLDGAPGRDPRVDPEAGTLTYAVDDGYVGADSNWIRRRCLTARWIWRPWPVIAPGQLGPELHPAVREDGRWRRPGLPTAPITSVLSTITATMGTVHRRFRACLSDGSETQRMSRSNKRWSSPAAGCHRRRPATAQGGCGPVQADGTAYRAADEFLKDTADIEAAYPSWKSAGPPFSSQWSWAWSPP